MKNKIIKANKDLASIDMNINKNKPSKSRSR